MDLATYLFREKIRVADFAAEIGRSASAVYRYRKCEVEPPWDAVLQIERVTGGKVTRKDLWPGRYP